MLPLRPSRLAITKYLRMGFSSSAIVESFVVKPNPTPRLLPALVAFQSHRPRNTQRLVNNLFQSSAIVQELFVVNRDDLE